MRVICVDDERLPMESAVSLLGELPQVEDARGFTQAADALAWLEEHPVDLALLDIGMPGMNGLELAVRIRTERPGTAIVFLTGHPQYALDAFSLHVSGYILKPATKERLREEIDYALSAKRSPAPGRVVMRTFGRFDCLVDGEALGFRQAKCKELLAYLVDRRGSSVTRSEAFAILWEDRLYDRRMQKQFDAILRSLRSTLQEHGIGDILELESGNLRIRQERIDCDLYRFLNGEAEALGAYRGEYMRGYAWAEITAAYMTRKQRVGALR